MNRAERRRRQKVGKKAATRAQSRQAANRPSEPLNPINQQYIDLAVQHHAAGRLTQAENLYKQILQTEPNQPIAVHMLGVIAQQVGKNTLAVDLISKALAIKPDYAEAHYNLGNSLVELGQPDKALASYRKALAIKPDFADAHNNLGNALKRLERWDEALASYHKVVAFKPDFAEGHNNLGNALAELGQPDKALASYRKALAIKPDFADAHNNLGIALKRLERWDEALASYRKALAIKPDFAEGHYNLAEVLEQTNRTEDLREAVTNAKRSCPGHPLLALGEARLLKLDGDYAAARAVLEEAGEPVSSTHDIARAYLLGDLCDRLDEAETAYNYFMKANLLSKHTSQVKRADGEHFLAQIDVLAQRFTADWIADWRPLKSGDERPDPVFLVGFPRSGTTLLDTILRSHASITVVEEMPTMSNVQIALKRLPGGYPDGLADLKPAHLAELRRTYFVELDKHLAREDRSAIVIDKLPLNAVHAGLIKRIFPQSRFLFAQRHPCDCVLSCFMTEFEINDAMFNFLELEKAARLYDKVMTLWQQYQTVLPLEVHTVRYESLVGALEETLTPVFEYLGVSWDEGVQNYAETAHRRGKINTPSYNQVTQPLYTRSRGRWERYRKHLQPVLPLLLPWTRRFGYGD